MVTHVQATTRLRRRVQATTPYGPTIHPSFPPLPVGSMHPHSPQIWRLYWEALYERPTMGSFVVFFFVPAVQIAIAAHAVQAISGLMIVRGTTFVQLVVDALVTVALIILLPALNYSMLLNTMATGVPQMVRRACTILYSTSMNVLVTSYLLIHSYRNRTSRSFDVRSAVAAAKVPTPVTTSNKYSEL